MENPAMDDSINQGLRACIQLNECAALTLGAGGVGGVSGGRGGQESSGST